MFFFNQWRLKNVWETCKVTVIIFGNAVSTIFNKLFELSQTHPLIEIVHYATKCVFQKLSVEEQVEYVFQSLWSLLLCRWATKQTVSAKEHFSVVCAPGAWHYSEARTKQEKYVLASVA